MGKNPYYTEIDNISIGDVTYASSSEIGNGEPCPFSVRSGGWVYSPVLILPTEINSNPRVKGIIDPFIPSVQDSGVRKKVTYSTAGNVKSASTWKLWCHALPGIFYISKSLRGQLRHWEYCPIKEPRQIYIWQGGSGHLLLLENFEILMPWNTIPSNPRR